MCSVELWHFGCPVAYTFVVTSRWPNLSRVSDRQDYVLCQMNHSSCALMPWRERCPCISSCLLFSEAILQDLNQKRGTLKLKCMDKTSGSLQHPFDSILCIWKMHIVYIICCIQPYI